ncbi:MAG: heme-binding domain-containing protein [Gillisia sp.]
MKVVKTIAIVLLVILVLIQFYRPEKNKSDTVPTTDITMVTNMPPDVKKTLQQACYDCHSNNTVYPVYYNFEPIAYWMANHVEDGKRHLDFSEWGNYSDKKKADKLNHAIKMVKNHKMPLDSYTWMHPEGKLSESQITGFTNWAKQYMAVNNLKEEENRPQ